MIGELDPKKKKYPAQQLGPGHEKSCRKSSSVGKYGINNTLLEISAVSYVSSECEVKREGNLI